jgi:hypothetical protein
MIVCLLYWTHKPSLTVAKFTSTPDEVEVLTLIFPLPTILVAYNNAVSDNV